MALRCPYQSCKSPTCLIRYGFFRRREDGRRIQRFRCHGCGRTSSTSTVRSAYRQHRRRLNPEIERLLIAKMNLAQIARHVGANPKTIARKLCYLGSLRLAELDSFRPAEPYRHVQFDEMQSSEHTKCKPLSIPVAVDARTYRILAFDVCSMPAQHPLVEISLRKYGPRRDDRAEAIAGVIGRIEQAACRRQRGKGPRFRGFRWSGIRTVAVFSAAWAAVNRASDESGQT